MNNEGSIQGDMNLSSRAESKAGKYLGFATELKRLYGLKSIKMYDVINGAYGTILKGTKSIFNQACWILNLESMNISILLHCALIYSCYESISGQVWIWLRMSCEENLRINFKGNFHENLCINFLQTFLEASAACRSNYVRKIRLYQCCVFKLKHTKSKQIVY